MNNKKFYALGRLKRGERNKTEAAFEILLKSWLQDGLILWYEFEGVKLKLADNTFFTVDFAAMDNTGMLIMFEVKGAAAIFQDDAKVKIKVAAKLYPFKFMVAIPKPKKDGGGWDIVEV
jgi:hypothetical protein